MRVAIVVFAAARKVCSVALAQGAPAAGGFGSKIRPSASASELMWMRTADWTVATSRPKFWSGSPSAAAGQGA